MKIKNYIHSLMILGLLTTSSFAFEGHNYKIVSTKITHSPGATGVSFEEKKESDYYPNMAIATAWAYDTFGKIREFVRLKGDHNIHIVNNTGEKKRYEYYFKISCYPDYADYQSVVDVGPYGDFISDMHSFVNVQRLYASTFPIIAYTTITGAEISTHQSTATLTIG